MSEVKNFISDSLKNLVKMVETDSLQTAVILLYHDFRIEMLHHYEDELMECLIFSNKSTVINFVSLQNCIS